LRVKRNALTRVEGLALRRHARLPSRHAALRRELRAP